MRRSKQMGRSTWLEGPGIVAMGTKKMGKMGGIPCRRHHSECLVPHLYSESKRVDPGLTYLYYTSLSLVHS